MDGNVIQQSKMIADHSPLSTSLSTTRSPNFFQFEFEDFDHEDPVTIYESPRRGPIEHAAQRHSPGPIRTQEYSVPSTEWQQTLFLHPNINQVVDKLVEGLDNSFNYGSLKLLMQIFDLQIVYRLSRAFHTPNSYSERIPENVLLPATSLIRAAEKISACRIGHHIAPDCFLEREIQLRALVSNLSLLRLLSKPGGERPVFEHNAKTTIRGNVIDLTAALHRSGGTAAQNGDCEFLLEYTFSLLDHLRNDEPIVEAVGSRIVNFLFAAGVAYQYNGREAINHLKNAFLGVETKPDAWYSEFDEHHHQVIGLLSFSLYFGHPQALRATVELIATLLQKLRDCFAKVNESGSLIVLLGRVQTRVGDVIGAEPAKQSAHLAYGLMYLIGRLVERLVAATEDIHGNDERKVMRNLLDFLVVICQTSRFEQLRYKAEELIFEATRLKSLPTLAEIESKIIHSHSRQRSINPNQAREWNLTIHSLEQREQFTNRYPSSQEVELLHEERKGHLTPMLDGRENKHPRRRSPGSAVSSPTSLISAASLLAEKLKSTKEKLISSFFDEDQENSAPPGDHGEPPSSARPIALGIRNLSETPTHWRSRSYPSPQTIQTHQELVFAESFPSHSSNTRINSISTMNEDAIHLSSSVENRVPFPSSTLSPQVTNHKTWTPTKAHASTECSLSPVNSSHTQSSGRSTSHAATVASRHTYNWKERPPKFSLERLAPNKPASVSTGKSPVAVKLSSSCKTVAFLSRAQVDVYSVPLSPKTSQELTLCLRHHSTANNTEYVTCAVNDKFVAAITRTKLDVLNQTARNPICRYITFDKGERLCCVAISNSTTQPLIAIGLIDSNGKCRVRVYELRSVISATESFEIVQSCQRILEFEPLPATVREFGDPEGLSFSDDGKYLVCSSSEYGVIRTWRLSSKSKVPDFYECLPGLHSNRGYGIAGVLSTTFFPSSRYILSTTGSPNGPAGYITARGHSPECPKMYPLFSSKGALVAGTVAPHDNAVAAISSRGKVFLSTLEENEPTGYIASSPEHLGNAGDSDICDLAFAKIGDDSTVLGVASIVRGRFMREGTGKVTIWTFHSAGSKIQP